MTLTKEQVKELKKQLTEQIKNLPPDRKEEAERQIESMSQDALESMLKQQKGARQIFRKIAKKESDSVYVGENSDAVAVLDINPISRGHIMIVPKKAVARPDEIPKNVFSLGEELSKKITSHLGAKSVRLETDASLGEAVIHQIPIYDGDLDKNSPRKASSPDELQEIKKNLETIKIDKKPKQIKIESSEEKKSEIVKLKRRIP